MPDPSQPSEKTYWRKSPPELITFFLEVIKPLPGIEPRRMFGYPCAFANGQMFTGLYQDAMFVRLSEADRAMFRELDGAQPFEPTPGRPMSQYSVVPPAMLHSPAELNAWLLKALSYANSLPPKEAKKKTARTGK